MAGEDIGPSSKAYCCRLVNGHGMPVTWTSLCHRLVLLSAFVREASFAVGGAYCRALLRIRACGVLSPQWDISTRLRLRDIAKERDERMEDPGEMIEYFRNTVFWPWHDNCLLLYFIYYILLCMCMMRGGHMSRCTCGGQRTSFWSDFSPSNLIWLLRLRSLSLKDKHIYPDSSPQPGPGTQQLWLSKEDLSLPNSFME